MRNIKRHKRILSILFGLFFVMTCLCIPLKAYGIDSERKLIVSSVNDLSETVEGITQGDAMIYVMSTGDMELGKGFADKDGKFSVKIPKLSPGKRIVVYAAEKIIIEKDFDYKPYAVRELEVEDITPPKAPTVRQSKGGLGISGSAERGSVIFIYVEGYLVISKKVSATGKFNIPIPYLAPGMQIEVVAVDTGGRFSPKTSLYAN